MTVAAEPRKDRSASAGPKCPACNSSRMYVPGFVSFHWQRGRLVPKRGSEMLNETGAPFACGDCGAQFNGNYEPPFDLEPVPNDHEQGLVSPGSTN